MRKCILVIEALSWCAVSFAAGCIVGAVYLYSARFIEPVPFLHLPLFGIVGGGVWYVAMLAGVPTRRVLAAFTPCFAIAGGWIAIDPLAVCFDTDRAVIAIVTWMSSIGMLLISQVAGKVGTGRKRLRSPKTELASQIVAAVVSVVIGAATVQQAAHRIRLEMGLIPPGWIAKSRVAGRMLLPDPNDAGAWVRGHGFLLTPRNGNSTYAVLVLMPDLQTKTEVPAVQLVGCRPVAFGLGEPLVPDVRMSIFDLPPQRQVSINNLDKVLAACARSVPVSQFTGNPATVRPFELEPVPDTSSKR